MFANQSCIVFLPNPRDSVGYGQKFVDEATADWSGRAFTNILNGVAEVIKNHSGSSRRAHPTAVIWSIGFSDATPTSTFG